jgi:hypothetical protein
VSAAAEVFFNEAAVPAGRDDTAVIRAGGLDSSLAVWTAADRHPFAVVNRGGVAVQIHLRGKALRRRYAGHFAAAVSLDGTAVGVRRFRSAVRELRRGSTRIAGACRPGFPSGRRGGICVRASSSGCFVSAGRAAVRRPEIQACGSVGIRRDGIVGGMNRFRFGG